MIYNEKKITLKDGRTAILRAPKIEDAAPMVQYLKDTAGETEFIMRYPEEVTMTAEREAGFFEHLAYSPFDMMIVCEVEGRLAGNCQINFGNKIKTRHRASVAIGLTKEFWNLGIGTAMFEEMIAVARNREGVRHIDLEFIEGNSRARALYEKMGFRIIAVKPEAIMLRDGTLLNEYLMRLVL